MNPKYPTKRCAKYKCPNRAACKRFAMKNEDHREFLKPKKLGDHCTFYIESKKTK